MEGRVTDRKPSCPVIVIDIEDVTLNDKLTNSQSDTSGISLMRHLCHQAPVALGADSNVDLMPENHNDQLRSTMKIFNDIVF